ncbi:MAG TPA: hypothetical protein PLV45_05130 [bacterium]|nr:hypothetical protein [bacterium]
MAFSIIGSIGAKLGLDLVSNVMEKTLPKAFDFMKAGMKTPVDAFEAVVNTFGGRASRTRPAQQFSLAFPDRLGFAKDPSFTDKMKSMASKLGNILSALGSLGGAVQQLSQCFGGAAGTEPCPGRVQYAGSTGFGSGLNVDTQAMAQSSGYGSEIDPGSGMDPMTMFQKMQEAQVAAQMFELAVKISEIQHQAAMSAIRGIRY